ncbi:MAG: hypothetical protein ACRDPY_43510 [Streptosporangiaceae bacterium]
MWAAHAAMSQQAGFALPPAQMHRREEPLRKARLAARTGRARAAEERGGN